MMARKDKMVLGGVCLIAGSAFAMATPAQANIRFFDIASDPGAWAAALEEAGKQVKGSWDFDLLNDFGILGISEPVGGGVGQGPIPADFVLDNIQLFSNLSPFGTGGMNPHGNDDPVGGPLVLVGPGAGFGNPSNALLINTFVDSMDIINAPLDHTAMEINVLTLLGGPGVTISVYDENAVLAGQMSVNAGIGGFHLGILVDNSDGHSHNLFQVNLYDPVDLGGAQGIQGEAIFYVPAPGSLALLGLAGLFVRRRRRP